MRTPVSAKQNLWSDGQSVDDENLNLEQDYNNQIHTSIINNHIGSGVIPENLSQKIIFDSSLSNDLLDGKFISAQNQPSDANNGNQLEVNLSGSLVAGKKSIKIIIIGLDFQNNLQYDTFSFSKNESQLTKKHYRNILAIFLNDFIGAPLQSFNLGGKILITEASPMSISRDTIMISQDVEPNLIFRDFFVSSLGTLSNLLSTSLPSYNIDALNIKTGYRQLRGLVENDVSSQIGQKFLSTSNNIQKITLLLSAVNNTTPANLNWTGDLIVSIYPLQSTIQSSTDIVPNLAIDFDPNNIPLAQISLDYTALQTSGIELNTVPQPVDFIFSNTPVGSGLLIKSGSYYVITVKRAGSADTCQIQVAVGSNTSADTRETLFNGSVWVDVPEEALWFRAYTDAAKVSDGQAYDAGKGIQIAKTTIDETTNTTIDNSLDRQTFLRNDVYNVILQANLKQSDLVQNQRTGNDIFSQKEYVPEASLLTNSQLATIQSVSEPLILGTISDQNVKSSSISGSTTGAAIHHYAMVDNEIVFKIIDDVSDPRYDQNLITMVADLVSGKLNEAKFIPNTSDPSSFYRISKAELLTLMYGDVNGDGVVDNDDLLAGQLLIGTDLNSFPSQHNYLVHTANFVNDNTLSWQVIDPSGPTIVASGSDGILTASGDTANFHSNSATFSTITSIGSFELNILNSTSSDANNSEFLITNLIDNNNITIRKILYTSDLFLQMLRADINNDMIINSTDVNLISNYLELTSPFPPSTLPSNRIGTIFNAIRFKVEKYIDRYDDYPGTDSDRSSTLHETPDIFLDGYAGFASINVRTSPINFNIVKQLNWKENNIVVNSNPKMVLAAFDFSSGYNSGVSSNNLNTSTAYPVAGSFDPGRNDLFIPNNLIINTGGQLTTPSGDYFKIDFEMNTISFEVPAVDTFGGEKTVNILTDFIADFTSTGFTRLGYKALKFADGSLATMSALSDNQARISVGVISFSPQINGITSDGYTGIIISPSIGVSMDYTTGLLTLNFNNLYQDAVKQTENTKVQITVYLKKAGWNNTPIVIDDTKTTNLLGL